MQINRPMFKGNSLVEVARSQIDDHKWNAKVLKYSEGRPYSLTWYLDCITQGKWSAIIYGDYEVIMPIPYHRKFLYQRRLYQPFLTQTFGPIGVSVTEEQMLEFALIIKNTYRNSHVMFPASDKVIDTINHVEIRSNQVINLDQDIESIRASYTKERRRIVNAKSANIEFQFDQDIQNYLDRYRHAEYPKTKPILRQMRMFENLLNICRDKGILEIITGYADNEVVTNAAMLVTDSRVINLIGASNIQSRKLSANILKIDAMISRYQGEKKVFDFFGSSIPGVHNFNAQFGALSESYLLINT